MQPRERRSERSIRFVGFSRRILGLSYREMFAVMREPTFQGLFVVAVLTYTVFDRFHLSDHMSVFRAAGLWMAAGAIYVAVQLVAVLSIHRLGRGRWPVVMPLTAIPACILGSVALHRMASAMGAMAPPTVETVIAELPFHYISVQIFETILLWVVLLTQDRDQARHAASTATVAADARHDPARPPIPAAPAAVSMATEGLPPARQRLFVGDRTIDLAVLHHIQASGHEVEVVTDAGREMHRVRLRDCVAQLPDDTGLQVNRSCWISRRALHGYLDDGAKLLAILDDGTRIPVSRGRGPVFRAWSARHGVTGLSDTDRFRLRHLARA